MGLRLVSFDLDGTLIHPAIFNAVADRLGFGEPLQESYRAYLAGTMTLEEAFHHDYAHFAGRRVEDLQGALEAHPAWTPGIPEAVRMLHDAGLSVILTTDQPSFLAEHVTRWGFDDLVCTRVPVGEDGCVPAAVTPRFAKWPNLEAYLEREGVPPAEVAHVGNGSNDIPVFERVGYGVAVNAENPRVTEAADAAIPRLEDVRDVARLILERAADAET